MTEDIRKAVQRRYARLAGESQSCCSAAEDCVSSACGEGYSSEDLKDLPRGFQGRSLGCGNPIAMARLQPGETVLDLGSGAGLDVLLASREVGGEGKVYGLDMTDEMLELAESNRREAGADNVELLKGDMESIPLPPESVDVIISNCVVNLSPDKKQVLQESHRVLRPGGRLAIFDLMWDREPPSHVREDAALWSCCIGGALTRDQARDLLAECGFSQIRLETMGKWGDCSADSEGNKVLSVLIRAVRPA